MVQVSPADGAAEMVAAALKRTAEENVHLRELLEAFGPILIEQARWKASPELPDGWESPAVDRARFEKGISATGREDLVRLGAVWSLAVERLMPALEAGFPKIREKLQRLSTAIGDGSFDPDRFFPAILGGRDEEALSAAAGAGMEAELLVFVLAQLARPVVERRAERLAPAIAGLAWNRGTCPVCGSFPEMSLLRGKEGHRWLRCSFCATLWQFQRMQCPFCDSQKPGDAEILFVEGRENERAEVCNGCRVYLPGMDLKGFSEEPVLAVAAFRLLHLDVLAREKGYRSATGGKWEGLQ